MLCIQCNSIFENYYGALLRTPFWMLGQLAMCTITCKGMYIVGTMQWYIHISNFEMWVGCNVISLSRSTVSLLAIRTITALFTSTLGQQNTDRPQKLPSLVTKLMFGSK